MSDVIDDANNGSKTASTSLSRLGLSLDDLNKMSTEEKFNTITAALADMEQGAERNALGNDLLGKAIQKCSRCSTRARTVWRL